MSITILRILLVNLFTSSCPLLDLILKYIGINVVPKAALIPSNKTTGILRAVRYASVISPAPNVCANTISLKILLSWKLILSTLTLEQLF